MRMELIPELISIGYDIALEGEHVKLCYRKEDSPPDRVMSLIEELKNCKAEVIEILRMKHIMSVSEIVESGTSVGVAWVNPHKQGTPEARQASINVVKEALAQNRGDS